VNLEDIVDAIRHNRIRITDHADEETHADRLSFDEVLISVFQGEIIEEYVDDSPDPERWIEWQRRRAKDATVNIIGHANNSLEPTRAFGASYRQRFCICPWSCSKVGLAWPGASGALVMGASRIFGRGRSQTCPYFW
jgi:hypothetical protein